MSTLQGLLDNNKAWAAAMLEKDPDFFRSQAKQQTPQYLWIGCSDSRVPASQILGLAPGEVFVHRNVANLIQPGDLNCMSVIKFALTALKIRHVIVCGHYGCGGVQAALEDAATGILEHWLWDIKQNMQRHQALLARVPVARRADLLCELNVVQQLMTLSRQRVIQDAWAQGAEIVLHGWIYDIGRGLITDLKIDCGKDAAPEEVYAAALDKIKDRYC